MLDVAVFLCGAAVMILEIVGARMLAPYLGTSIVVWTGLIGVILASLSVGYAWGGRLADRRPDPGLLSALIALAAAAVALTALGRNLVLEFLQGIDVWPHLKVLLAALVLFVPASLLLGMVSPFAVRLKIESAGSAGATAGRLYALSTLGSIVGTFLAGFVLIAWFGSGKILLVLALLLVLASLCASRSALRLKLALALAIGVLLWLTHSFQRYQARQGYHDLDTNYSRVLVYDSRDIRTGRPMRVLKTSPVRVQSAMFPDEPVALALTYTRFFRLADLLTPPSGRMLVLGGGACSYPRHVHAVRPDIALDVVELDPGISALAERFFGLSPAPGFRLVHADARVFLNNAHGVYDAILCDTFDSDYTVPFHLSTREAVQRLHALLAENGLVIHNVISAIEGEQGEFLRALHDTYAAVFERVDLYPLHHPSEGRAVQNVMLVARKTDTPLPDVAGADAELSRWLAGRWTRPVVSAYGPLTDERAPVEILALALWE